MDECVSIKTLAFKKKMKTQESNEFRTYLQRYVFVTPDADINPETNLPFHKSDYCVVDVDDIYNNGNPINVDGEDMELWAILDPGEQIPL